MRSNNVPLEPNEAPELRQMIKELGNKLDEFIRSIPTLYMLRSDIESWKVGIEAKIKTLEEDNKTGRQWANDEHTKIASQIQTSEQRILEKLDEKNTKTWEQRVSHIFATFGWIIAIGALLLGYILQHLPH